MLIPTTATNPTAVQVIEVEETLTLPRPQSPYSIVLSMEGITELSRLACIVLQL
jgi:hypothetical protein